LARSTLARGGGWQIKQRVEHVKEQGRANDLNAARADSVSGSKAAAGLEEGLWLCPIEDRRRLDSTHACTREGFSLGSYLLLVEYTGRLFRAGKAVISGELAGVLERLGSSAKKLASAAGEAGHRLAAGLLLRRQPSPVARSRRALGVRHLANLGGCTAR
jgi:hypothetical protein